MDDKATGRSVRLFLPDGGPHGIVVAEIGNWTGKVLTGPRARLPALLARTEVSRTGVYILLGPDPDRVDGQLAYIGEADDVAARVRNHLRSETKDFADRFAFVVSADEALTKAHVRYLEGRLIRLVKEAGSVSLTNDTSPDFQRLPEADRSDMEHFLIQLQLVLPLVGFDILRRRSGKTSRAEGTDGEPIFEFTTAGVSARARETDDGFVVEAGSTARCSTSETFQAGYRALREKLVAAGDLVNGPSPDAYQFAREVVFSSPSAAAAIVAGRSASGPVEWRVVGTGQTYRDWRQARLDRA